MKGLPRQTERSEPPQPNRGRNHQSYENRSTAAEGTNVKSSTKAVVGVICLGTILYSNWRWYRGPRRIRNFHLTNEDFNYSDRSAEELISQHLIDLNGASVARVRSVCGGAGTFARKPSVPQQTRTGIADGSFPRRILGNQRQGVGCRSR
jgi:hypothetical protein